MARGAIAYVISAFVCAACSPSYVIVTVDDPKDVARDADSVAVGFELASLEDRPLNDRSFPVSFSLAYSEATDVNLYVEARARGNAIARAFAPVTLNDSKTPVTLELGAACSSDNECSDGLYCNGTESCLNGLCVDGPVPCPDLNSCATNRCDEDFDVCEIRLDEMLDDFDPCTIDGCGEGRTILHLPVPDGDSCIGRPGHCSNGQCVIACHDGFWDAPVEECDHGPDTPSCIDCKIHLRRVSTIGGRRGAISGDGKVVAFRDPGHVYRLNLDGGEPLEIAGFTGIGGDDRVTLSADGTRVVASGFGYWVQWEGDEEAANQIDNIMPIEEMALSTAGDKVALYSSMLDKIVIYPFNGLFPEREWDLRDTGGTMAPQLRMQGSTVAFRGVLPDGVGSTTCEPCVRLVTGETIPIGDEAFDWAFANDGLTLFVASETGGAVLRYEAPFTGAGVPVPNTDGAFEISASFDGQRLAFTTSFPLEAGDTNGLPDVYVLDRAVDGAPRRLATAMNVEPNRGATDPRISLDGNFVIFTSDSTNLDPTDLNELPDVFVAPFLPPPPPT